jgi:hypothetical protein
VRTATPSLSGRSAPDDCYALSKHLSNAPQAGVRTHVTLAIATLLAPIHTHRRLQTLPKLAAVSTGVKLRSVIYCILPVQGSIIAASSLRRRLLDQQEVQEALPSSEGPSSKLPANSGIHGHKRSMPRSGGRPRLPRFRAERCRHARWTSPATTAAPLSQGARWMSTSRGSSCAALRSVAARRRQWRRCSSPRCALWACARAWSRRLLLEIDVLHATRSYIGAASATT